MITLMVEAKITPHGSEKFTSPSGTLHSHAHG